MSSFPRDLFMQFQGCAPLGHGGSQHTRLPSAAHTPVGDVGPPGPPASGSLPGFPQPVHVWKHPWSHMCALGSETYLWLPVMSVPSPGTGSPLCLARRQLCLAEAETWCRWGEFRWHQTRLWPLLWYPLLSPPSYRCSSFFYAFCQVKSSPPCLIWQEGHLPP